MASTTADDRGALRPPAGDDITGRLRTQTGPRTTAPMWARPLLTDGEWAVFTALWSFASWNGDSTFPTHQALADRAWVERGTAANAVRKFAKLGMLTRARQTRADGSDRQNDYLLVEVCPPALFTALTKKMAERIDDQERKRKARRKANREFAAAAARRRRDGTDDTATGSAEDDGALDDAAAEDADAAAQLAAALAGEGALPDAPPGVHHTVHPGGTSPNGPGYTVESTHDLSIDLPKDDQSPPRVDDDAAAACEPGEAATRGDQISPEEKTRKNLNAAVDRVVTARADVPGWAVGQVRRAVRACLDAGHAPADVVAALDYAAADKATRAPGRLPHIVAELVAQRNPAPAAPAGRPAAAEGPVRYIDADRPRCPRHRDYPADNCPQDALDARIAAGEARIAAEDGTTPPPALSGAAARDAARAAAAAAKEASPTRKADRRPIVPRQAAPADPAPTDETTSEPAEPAAELASTAA